MRLIYNTNDGAVLCAVREADYPLLPIETTLPTAEYVIDDVVENRDLLTDAWNRVGRVGANGEAAYYVVGGVLQRNDDWQEWRP